ncbi:MAG: helix-turn-helix domain-containing protein [Actinomycetia bacterium]|nr:helix-turn-helix domain-containing protein [Actinomycetes bacterium]
MGGSLTVSSIAEQVPDISQSALSQNLSQLRTAGILQAEKSGQNVRYTLADQRIRQVLTVLEQNYCH